MMLRGQAGLGEGLILETLARLRVANGPRNVITPFGWTRVRAREGAGHNETVLFR
jgi:hypothetical protein